MTARWLMLVCLSVALLVGWSCAPAKTPAKAQVPAGYKSVRMVGSSVGAKATTVTMAYSAILNKYYKDIEWSSVSGAAGTSVIYIMKDTVKLAMSPPGSFIDAFGLDKVAESRLRSISLPAPMSVYGFLIPADKPWKDITEVPKGARLCPGTPATTSILMSEAWLGTAGLGKSDFNWLPMTQSEMVDAWRSGKLDLAWLPITGVTAVVTDMYTSRPSFKYFGMTEAQAARAKAERTFEQLGGFSPQIAKISEIYGDPFKYDIISPQSGNFLVSRDDFNEDVAYRMAKVMDEHRDELAQIFPPMKYGTPQYHIQWAQPPVDVHSGVAKYYREKGYLK